MVETVLESFDFLNADCSADELSLFGSIRTASVRYVGAALHSQGQGKGVRRVDPSSTYQYTILGWVTIVQSSYWYEHPGWKPIFSNTQRYLEYLSDWRGRKLSLGRSLQNGAAGPGEGLSYWTATDRATRTMLNSSALAGESAMSNLQSSSTCFEFSFVLCRLHSAEIYVPELRAWCWETCYAPSTIELGGHQGIWLFIRADFAVQLLQTQFTLSQVSLTSIDSPKWDSVGSADLVFLSWNEF